MSAEVKVETGAAVLPHAGEFFADVDGRALYVQHVDLTDREDRHVQGLLLDASAAKQALLTGGERGLREAIMQLGSAYATSLGIWRPVWYEKAPRWQGTI